MDNNEKIIEKNFITAILETRWEACYMVTDWNPTHAARAFGYSEEERCRQTFDRMEKARIDAFLNNKDANQEPEAPKSAVDTYNEVLAEEIEARITGIMTAMECDRMHAELMVAEALAELCGTESKGEEKT